MNKIAYLEGYLSKEAKSGGLIFGETLSSLGATTGKGGRELFKYTRRGKPGKVGKVFRKANRGSTVNKAMENLDEKAIKIAKKHIKKIKEDPLRKKLRPGKVRPTVPIEDTTNKKINDIIRELITKKNKKAIKVTKPKSKVSVPPRKNKIFKNKKTVNNTEKIVYRDLPAKEKIVYRDVPSEGLNKDLLAALEESKMKEGGGWILPTSVGVGGLALGGGLGYGLSRKQKATA